MKTKQRSFHPYLIIKRFKRVFPTEKELISFIKRKGLVNFSMIAKHFDIKNTTVSDLIASLEKNKVLKVKKLGGSKIVLLK